MNSQLLTKVPIIPVLRKVPYEKSRAIIQSLVDGGIQSIEITMDSDYAVEIIHETKSLFGDLLSIGAGTVMSKEDCDNAIAAGAQFLVSPHLNEEIVKYAASKGLLVIPGVFTPSEIVRARELGATIVKLFPSSVLGPQFVKDVRGPLGDLSIMCTGGITKETAKTYLDAGAVAIGAGGALLKEKYIRENDWSGLEEETKEWISKIEEYVN